MKAAALRTLVLVVLVIAVVGGVLAGSAGRARADVLRYALLIGNDAGEADETRLRFAQTDATRLGDIFRDLGGFDTVIVAGASADEARHAVIRMNERIRDAIRPGDSALLVVYYSGHADEEALHLGPSRLGLGELEALVRGSAAAFRMLIVDACRSGALTRVKGGTRAAPFPVVMEAHAPGEGVVYLTASSSSEDAQESDELGGSFFTHHLASGLLGAADRDGDGAVTIAEAYEHAYAATLRATSRTLAGTQHPTFRYEYRGSGDVVLTQPGATKARAKLRLPSGRTYLVLRGGGNGAVVAEVGVADERRPLSLAPGHYFLRGRGPGDLLEGEVALASGDDRTIREAELERIAYAHLVRKGGAGHTVSLSAGGVVRQPIIAGAGVCLGGFGGAALDLPVVSLGLRVGGCHGDFANEFLDAATDEIWTEVRAFHTIDVGGFGLSFGVTAGGSVLYESFSSAAPSRRTLGLVAGAGLGIDRPLGDGVFVALEGDALTYFFSVADGGAARFAVRAAVLVGKQL